MAGLAASWYITLEGKGLAVIQVMRVSGEGEGLPSLEELQRWRMTNGARYEVVRDPEGTLPLIHPMPGMASSVIVDRHQEIRLQARPSPEELLDILQELLGEE